MLLHKLICLFVKPQGELSKLTKSVKMARYRIACTLIERGSKFIYLQSNSLSPFKAIAGDWYGLLRSFWCFNITYLALITLLYYKASIHKHNLLIRWIILIK